MTNFEVERLKQAFDVIANDLVSRYEDAAPRCDNPKQLKKNLRRDLSTLQSVKKLLENYGLMTAGEPQTPEKLADPNRLHCFRFNVSYTGYVPEECSIQECKITTVQVGSTEKEAGDFLKSHIEFEHCNDKNFSNLEIKLIDQFY